MNKILLPFIISLFAIHISNAQKLKGNKNVITEEREVTSFSSIVVKNKCNLFLEKSNTNSLRIEADENLLPAIETNLIDGVLEISLSQEILRKKALNIYVGVTKSIRRIEAQDRVKIIGKNDIYADSIELIAKDYASIELTLIASKLTLKGEDKSSMELSVNSNGDLFVILDQKSFVKMNTATKKLKLSLTGNSAIELSGNCKELIATTNTNSRVRAKDLLADYAAINTTGKSNVYINVAKEIIIEAEELSEIYLYGTPKVFIDGFKDRSTLYKR